MVGAADNPPRPTMSMLGDHQMLGGLQQLVRRPAEENTIKAHLPDGEPGISTAVATDETNAGESDAAAFGGGQGGRRHGGIDEEKAAGQTTQQLEMMRLDDWGEERLPEEIEDSLDLVSGEKRKGGWWTDSWISQKLFGDAAGEGGEVSDSPLRRLVRPALDWMPNLRLPGRRIIQPSTRRGLFGHKKGRDKRRRKPQAKGEKAKDIARKIASSSDLVKELENKFNAVSSLGPKESKAKLVNELLQAIEGSRMAYPLSVDSLKMLAATLLKAGYKSAEQYLGEAKLRHVELGFKWTEQLDLAMRRCKAAVTRGMGPRKRAPELPQTRMWNMMASPDPPRTVVKWSKELFLFAAIWMLRCAELIKLRAKDIVVNPAEKTVTLMWKESKTDQKAGGVSRVLQCVCKGSCSFNCPVRLSDDLKKKVEKRKAEGDHLCALKRSGVKATKAQVVASWSRVWAMKLTGHSARRSGALQYIRNGWQISQVAYLGRWKSGVIYNYAAEALESLPVNKEEKSFVQHLDDKDTQGLDKVELGKEALHLLELEVAEFRRDAEGALKTLKEEVKNLETNFGNAMDSPPNVQSVVSKVVHRNVTMVANTPPALWKTWCGWHFRGGNFWFVSPTTEVTCAKCLAHMDAQSKEVEVSTMERWVPTVI